MNHWTINVLRFVVGGVLVLSALSKIADPVAFAIAIDAYRLTSVNQTMVVAQALPPMEVFCGICLLSGMRVRAVFLIAALFFTAFTAAQASVVVRGIEAPCGCGLTIGGDTVGASSIMRVIVLLSVSTMGFLFSRGKQSHES